MVLLSACKKDKDEKKDDNCSLSETNLVAHYKITSVKYQDSTSAPEVEVIDDFLEPCEKDDIFTFNADHTYENTDAGTICDENNTYDGSWSLSENVLSVDGDPALIENFTCTGFSAVVTDFDFAGDKLTVTYTKQ